MITPFGRLTLFIASPHEPIRKSLSKYIQLFIGPKIPHRFTEEDAITLTCIEDLYDRLDSLKHQDLFNTLCLLDCTNTNDSIINDKEKQILILRYPEVYWVFLENNPKGGSKEQREIHYVDVGALHEFISLLHRHLYGFRAWFDPTGLRQGMRRKLLSKEDESKEDKPVSNHSASFTSQAIAGMLLKRAQNIKNGSPAFQEGIHAALLALEAWLILRGKTLAMGLDALDILYSMEAAVECSFVGASTNLPVDRRIKELESLIDILNPYKGNEVSVKLEKLSQDVNFPNFLSKKIKYNCARKCLIFIGVMEEAERNELVELSVDEKYKQTVETLFQRSQNNTPKGVAAVIEEEETFILLNGYTLYSYGYDTYVIPSLKEMKNILGFKFNNGKGATNISPEGTKIDVILEDLDLRFGDAKEADLQYFEIDIKNNFWTGVNNRADHFPKINSSIIRIFLSSVSISSLLKERKKSFLSVVKPYGGVFDNDLWKPLKAGYAKNKRESETSPQFPPHVRDRLFFNFSIPEETNNSKDYNSGSPWFRQKYNALIEITNDLRKIYQNHDQFDEEEEALIHLRNYQLRLRKPSIRAFEESDSNFAVIPKSSLSKINGCFGYCLTWYLNKSIESFRNQFVFISAWLILFSFIYQISPLPEFNDFWEAFLFSSLNFLQLPPPLPKSIEHSVGWFRFMVLFEGIVAFFHLGIFISYLYQKISRK